MKRALNKAGFNREVRQRLFTKVRHEQFNGGKES